METLSVTLIVKAPNQQIEDQTVKCDLSWTINKLKQHLSEVYPSKPAKHEQKLIYSGQLLSDTVVLRDVLRQYEGQETHTMHLVCTSKQMNTTTTTSPVRQQTPSSSGETSGTTREDVDASSFTANTSTQADTQGVDNARQQLPFGQWNMIPPTMPMDYNQYMLQMAYMQQAYWQYMNQYMQMNQGFQNVTPAETPAAQDQQDQAQAVQDPQVVQQQHQRDPDQAERDWLDVFYILSRVLVLFSVVYFYSSPFRFAVVVCLGLGLYLYQIGFFRNVNINNNNNNVRDGEQQNQQQAENPSMLTMVWTFFAMFFTSLIPEIPQAV